MTWRTHRVTIQLRNIARRLGINRWLARLILGKGYESSFQNAVLSATNAGDCAWDIGANVGLYTVKLAERVGHKGRVFAFEPSPINVQRLAQAVSAHPNVRVILISSCCLLSLTLV